MSFPDPAPKTPAPQQSESSPDAPPYSDAKAAQDLARARARFSQEIGKVVVGQEEAVEHVFLTLLAGGNSILVGVPGLAKTLLLYSVARVVDLKFSRVQFTPDLMPTDITGTDIIQQREDGSRGLEFSPGPIFANLILADEINRAPPKTQAALLEAMQERQVSVQNHTYALDAPFFVFATQNPIELEGTYPLPEAQLDRFMFFVRMDHLPEQEEVKVVRETTDEREPELAPVVTRGELLAFQRLVRRAPVSQQLLRYAVRLARATRPKRSESPDFIDKWVAHGASVRAAQFMALGAKAKALAESRETASFEDVRALAQPVLRHRIILNFRAESEGKTTDELVERLLGAVKPPSSGM